MQRSDADVESKLPVEMLDGFDDLEIKKGLKTNGHIAVTRHTHFLITINNNISYRTLDTRDKRVALGRKLLEVSDRIKQCFERKQLLSKYGNKPLPNLLSMEPSIQVGRQSGHVHVHILAKFDNNVKIDLPLMRVFLKHEFGGHVPHVNVKQFKDNAAIVRAYAERDAALPFDDRPPTLEEV